ncbi:unnamed protein product [Echinostoma caproni]|uniref:SAM domain-containing protein n=1 Tax=Echinostoma caproni TaxID=27848 RepID=A0A183AZ27_9TREM|nr:unnamed protein product [Echinostoma caproni]
MTRSKPDGEDVVTPTGNGPVNIALGTCSEPPSPQLPPRPSAIIRALNSAAAKRNNFTGSEFNRPINGQPVAVLATGPRNPPEAPLPAHRYHPVLVDTVGVPPDSTSGSTSTSNFSSGFDTVRPVNVTPVVQRPQPTFSPPLSNSHTPSQNEVQALPEGDVQSMCTASNSEDSSTATLSCARSTDRDPQPVNNMTGTDASVPPPPAAPSTRSSDDGRSRSARSSLNSESLVLPPPSPWNVNSDTPMQGVGDAVMNNAAVCPPSMFMDSDVADGSSLQENRIYEGVFPRPVGKYSPEPISGHPVSTRIVQSEPVCPVDRLTPASGTPQSGPPLALFTDMDTFGSDPFTSSPAISPDYTKVEELDSDSTGVLSSSMAADENTYAFSTLDSEYLAWMRLSVRDVTGMKLSGPSLSALDLDSVDSLRRAQVHHWVDLFNSNPLGLRLNFVSLLFFCDWIVHCRM